MEERPTCAQHELIQSERMQRYAELNEKIDSLDERLEALHRTTVQRDIVWWFAGIAAVIFSWLFLNVVTKSDFSEHKREREQRLTEVREMIKVDINKLEDQIQRINESKEDKHEGIHDTPVRNR